MVIMAEGKKELVLVNNEYAWVKDLSGGQIYVYLGPHKEPLSVDSEIVIQGSDREFRPIGGNLLKGVTFTVALESQYVILHNPEVAGQRAMTKGKNDALQLQTGKSIIRRGPCEFPLWPGQQANVINGHRLTSDQFLRIRVEGEVAEWDVKALQELLKEDWLIPKPVMKAPNQELDLDPDFTTLGEHTQPHKPTPAKSDPEPVEIKLPELTIGSEWIVRGSKTKFFIPPTGVKVLLAIDEVTKSEDDPYVMNGVPLDADEYVVLKNRSGRISYVLGSTTVIPCEDQVFVTDRSGVNPVFKAQSIDENSGVLLRTLVPMTRSTIQERMGYDVRIQFTPVAYFEDDDIYEDKEEDPKDLNLPPGTQLVVWREKRLVFPADGIQIIRKFEATHILAGTARYVKNSLTGRTRIVQGECLYLADPRCEEFTSRQLSKDLIGLWFPGTSVESYNPDLVPCITVPQGTAAMILKRGTGSSTRKTVVGYTTYFLEWDETLCEMKLSTSRGGEAKTYQNAIRVCYLWMKSNRINDVLTDGRTREDCEFEVQYTLTVDFEEAHKDSWFNVDDYVFLVCEEVRSRLRGGLLATPISELSTNYVEIIRDIVLGTKPSVSLSKSEENALTKLADYLTPHRPGIEFPRFGARLVDININAFSIQDPKLQAQLRTLQMAGINESVQTRSAQIALEGARTRADIERERSTLLTKVNEFNQDQELRITMVTEDTKRKKADEAQKTALALVTADKAKSLAEIAREAELAAKNDEMVTTQRTTLAALADIDLKIATLKQQSGLAALAVTAKDLEIKRLDELDRNKGLAEAAATVNASILPTLGAHLAEIRDSLVSEKLIGAFGSVANFRGMDITELATNTLSALPGVGKVLDRMRRGPSRDEPGPGMRRGSRE
jgi:hypothetical protein